LAFITIATVLLAGAVAVFWPVPVLRVTAGEGKTLWTHALQGPLELRLEYQHSVERTPIVEVYVAGPGHLQFTSMEFVSHGAGLPTSGYVREGGRFVLREVRELPVLPIRVSRLAGPRLVIERAGVLDLVALAGDGSLVEVSSGRLPRVVLWLRRPVVAAP
jgi:hypothetical protein